MEADLQRVPHDVNYEDNILDVAAIYEKNLILIGCTAIEDRL